MSKRIFENEKIISAKYYNEKIIVKENNDFSGHTIADTIWTSGTGPWPSDTSPDNMYPPNLHLDEDLEQREKVLKKKEEKLKKEQDDFKVEQEKLEAERKKIAEEKASIEKERADLEERRKKIEDDEFKKSDLHELLT